MLRRLALCLVLSSLALAPQAAPAQPLPLEDPAVRPGEEGSADFVRVRKAARTLEVWSNGQLLLTIVGIQLGPAPQGPKRFEGDGRTPEGRYRLDWRNPDSAYHLSLHISYPDAEQVAEAAAEGRDAGGMVMVHGQPNGSATRMRGDWTDGCIALSDPEIEAVWSLVPDGAMIEITP